MTKAQAILKFEKQRLAAKAVLDSGFGTHPGESDRLYRERKELAEIALEALREAERAAERERLLWKMLADTMDLLDESKRRAKE